jgi:hypothetical protein
MAVDDVGGGLRQHMMDRADEIFARQHRAAVAAKAERQRPRALRHLDQAGEVALDARAVDQHRP